MIQRNYRLIWSLRAGADDNSMAVFFKNILISPLSRIRLEPFADLLLSDFRIFFSILLDIVHDVVRLVSR